MTHDVGVRELGLIEYRAAWQAMQHFTNTRDADSDDEIWLLQHPPVFTRGRPERPNTCCFRAIFRWYRWTVAAGHLSRPRPVGWLSVARCPSPGIGVRELVSRIERSLIDLLGEYGVEATAKPMLPVFTSMARRSRRWACAFATADPSTAWR